MDYKERSTVWKTDHVLAVCDDITRASSLEYIFTRNCPLPFCPYSNCGSSHSCRRRRGHSDRGVEYSRVFPHWWKGSFGQVRRDGVSLPCGACQKAADAGVVRRGSRRHRGEPRQPGRATKGATTAHAPVDVWAPRAGRWHS